MKAETDEEKRRAKLEFFYTFLFRRNVLLILSPNNKPN